MSQRSPGRGTERRGLAALACLLLAGTAPAQEHADPACPSNPTWPNIPQMRFTVRQVDGQPVLIGEGVIDREMIPRLRQALEGFRGDEIRLSSPGGDARVGNLAGRLIRTANLTTRIPDGAACASACAFMFLGGIVRHVDEHGLLMMQMFTHASDPPGLRQELARGGESAERLLTAIARDSAQLASEDNSYLIAMGISRHLLTEIVYQTRAFDSAGNPAPPRCLTAEEMRRYNVVTPGEPPAR